MCGIAGFNWKDGERIASMVRVQKHRGPDASGVFVDDGVSLGHDRLSIIDLSESANQPMIDNKGDLAIVFNGEIYNFEELKKELTGEYYEDLMFKEKDPKDLAEKIVKVLGGNKKEEIENYLQNKVLETSSLEKLIEKIIKKFNS